MDGFRAGFVVLVRRLGRSLLPVTTYRPDVTALGSRTARIVVGGGASSGSNELPLRVTRALAGTLGTPVTEFPGDHAGFYPLTGGDPVAFADTVRFVPR